MTDFGKIKNYDRNKGSGTIAPEKGGETLSFGKGDLQQEAAEPRQGQRYGYDTRKADDGKMQATNLHQPEQAQQGKAPSGQDNKDAEPSQQQG